MTGVNTGKITRRFGYVVVITDSADENGGVGRYITIAVLVFVILDLPEVCYINISLIKAKAHNSVLSLPYSWLIGGAKLLHCGTERGNSEWRIKTMHREKPRGGLYAIEYTNNNV